MSVMQFFLSKLHTKNYRFHALRIFEIQKNFWDNVSCGNPFLQKQTLADMLCRIPAQSSFVENFQERLQVHLKRTPLQMFPKVAEKLEKPTKKIEAVYKNSSILYKLFFMPMARLPNGRSVLLLNEKLL